MTLAVRFAVWLIIFFLCPPIDSLRSSDSTPQTLTILHTSEHHGALIPFQFQGAPVGGVARRATLIKEIRGEGRPVLLVDSGDILIGTTLASFFRGEPDILAMNHMGYHAMAAGNHDFDYGLEHLRRLQDLAAFPILCSNVTGRNADLPCRSSTVVRLDSFSIGLIGLLGRSNFPDTFNQEVVKALIFRDPIETAQTLARSLRMQGHADLVIAVTHQDTDEDLALLAAVPEVDVIIGGHTGGFNGLRTPSFSTPLVETNGPARVFVKTHRQGRTMGRLDLRIAGAKVASAAARNLPVSSEIAADPEVSLLVGRYAEKLEKETAAIVGQALVELDGESHRVRSQETNLGNLLADLLRTEFGSEIALINSGQIRDSIQAGPVTMQQVLRVLPFDSSAVTMTITGAELKKALENSVSRLPQTSGRFLQVSGLAVAYDLASPPGSRVRNVTVGGRSVDDYRRYSVATESFIADGGDGFTMLTAGADRVERQAVLRDLFLAALRAGPLSATVDGRIQFAGSLPKGKSHR